jgi:riboflavin synthase
MFTGIVEETGRVAETRERGDVLEVRLSARAVLTTLAPGGSIAVDGCCLTAVEVDAAGFRCELTRETLRRTAFQERLVPGRRVNLERPLRADGRFEGHVVQGHVDGLGRVVEVRPDASTAEVAVEAPEALARYLVEKGSVAVNGVSLTVAGLRGSVFTVALIPYTLEVTNLGDFSPGDALNLEMDVIAKYVERLLGLGRPLERDGP